MTENKAIIWDMNGVISDTQTLHATVESELLARYDINMSPSEITAKYAGVKTSEFFDDLLRKKGAVSYDVNKLMNEKWERAVELVPQVQAIPGVIKLIKEANQKKIPQAVASASGKKYVNAVLTQLGLINYFSAIVSGDQVSRGKPDPEIFIKAANSLKIEPQYCVVIEDGRSGMIGAKKAGMRCIGLVYDKQDYPADLLVNSLDKLDLNEILSL